MLTNWSYRILRVSTIKTPQWEANARRILRPKHGELGRLHSESQERLLQLGPPACCRRDRESHTLTSIGGVERAGLQAAVGVAAVVPVTAGLLGVLRPHSISFAGTPSSLTHAAYLSGLLLAIGLGFWSLIPSIERQKRNFTLLSAIVIIGGLARAFAALKLGVWGPSVFLPLTMELGVTPMLCLWQRRISKIT